MLLKRTLVSVILINFQIALAAIDIKSFENPDINLKLTYQSQEWLAFDADDFVASGSLFFAKPKSLKLQKATLSLRADESSLASSKRYVEKWLKDYPKFGFDLLLSQKAVYGQLEGYEIELRAKQGDKKIRQFVSKNSDNKFLIFTCSAEKDIFDKALKACQKVFASAEKLAK
ncbi:MAG: hypothetical protein IPM57_10860 [Oligoflexia bacterium]|nr:hypothetical protein [Oligoflexia bacterium]